MLKGNFIYKKEENTYNNFRLNEFSPNDLFPLQLSSTYMENLKHHMTTDRVCQLSTSRYFKLMVSLMFMMCICLINVLVGVAE